MKKLVLATVVSMTLAPAAYAQAVDVASVRAACLVGGGACIAAVQTLLASPAYIALPPADRTALIGTVAAEVRSVGLESAVATVDADVVAALNELVAEAVEEGDVTLSNSIEEAAAQVDDGETTETADPIAFSNN